jgi:streptogramin lyase
LLKDRFCDTDTRCMRVLTRATILSCLAGLLTASTAAAAPTITEFAMPQPDLQPLGIAAVPGGSLLFAEGSKNAFGLRMPSGSIVSVPSLSGPAAGVAISDGYGWLTEPGANRIARVDGFGFVTEFQLPGGMSPEGITAGPDGNVWFTEKGGKGAIGMITPTGTVTQYTAGLTQNSQPTAITAGPDGNLWFTETANPGRIGRITPSGAITEYTTGLTPNSQPTAITAGSDGNVWFTETANPGRIGRITPSGAITEYSAGLTSNRQPSGITAGPGGDLWFTEAGNPGAIGWITPQGLISQMTTPTANSQPDAITEAATGTIWFTEDGNHGQLGSLTVPAPVASTAAATAVSATSATLAGTVNPNGFTTTYHFDWGTTAAYGQRLPALDASAGAGSSPTPVTQVLTGLTPGTTYHFRLVASDCGSCSNGTVDGSDMTFTTASAAAGAGSSPAHGPVAAPVMGQSAVARVVRGTVLLRVRGSKHLQPLTAGRNIPLGSLIDASHGRLNLTTEIDRHGRMQTAAVWGGRFVIGQTGSRGMTTFRPATGHLDCPAHPRGQLRAQAISAHGKTSTSLWSKDNHGRYSTRGHNSVATVRGTEWKTVESCQGTLTFVKKGVVSVLDLHTHHAVLVHAGHSFLARP